MITHPVREEVVKLGSLVVYYFWYIDPKHLSRPAVQKFYWHDTTTPKSVGPFASVTEAMIDYTKEKKGEKALQRSRAVQELQLMKGAQLQIEYPKSPTSWEQRMAVWDPEEKRMKFIPVRGRDGRNK